MISIVHKGFKALFEMLLTSYPELSPGDMLDNDYAIIPNNGDRFAAFCLPLAFLGLDNNAGSPADKIQSPVAIDSALAAGASSSSLEVRLSAACGFRLVIEAPCREVRIGRCWHESIWQAIEAGARTTVLGKRFEDGQRQVEPITDDIPGSLARASDQDLMLTHIVPAAISVLDAARSRTCIRSRAEQLRDCLLDSYARATCHWAKQHYHCDNERHAAFVSALLLWAKDEGPQVVAGLAAKLSKSPDALSEYLHALATVATFETDFVPVLAQVWPKLMEIGLSSLRDAEASGWHHEERLWSNLVPSPSGFGNADDLDAILAKARSSWFPLCTIEEHIQEWLEGAEGEMLAVDALVGFLWGQPLRQQVRPGLEWVQRLVVENDGTASTSGFLLVSWLAHLRKASVLDAVTGKTYRSIVDALVLSNFRDARSLQQLDE